MRKNLENYTFEGQPCYVGTLAFEVLAAKLELSTSSSRGTKKISKECFQIQYFTFLAADGRNGHEQSTSFIIIVDTVNQAAMHSVVLHQRSVGHVRRWMLARRNSAYLQQFCSNLSKTEPVFRRFPGKIPILFRHKSIEYQLESRLVR